MSTPAPEPDAQDPAAERRAARLRATRALTRIGLKFAEALERDLDAAVETPAEDARPALQESARAFAQVSSAVSLAVALEDRLDQDPETRRLEAEARAARARAEALRAEQSSAEALRPHRRREIRTALQALLAADRTLSPRRQLEARLDLDRMIDRELADLDRLLRRPAGETIARLCRSLGLHPDWESWDTAWAREAEAFQPLAGPQRGRPVPPDGSPLAPRAAAPRPPKRPPP